MAAVAPLAALATLVAFEADAAAAPTVALRTPTTGTVVTNRLFMNVAVRVTAVGGYPVSQVKATMGATTIDLSYNAAQQEWLGQFNPLPVPSGPATLSVTAYDTAPSQTTVTADVIRDDMPVIVVESGHISLLQPLMPRFKLRCTDDGPAGCASLELGIQRGPVDNFVPLATGTSSIDSVVDLSPYANLANTGLVWRATDARGTYAGGSAAIYPTATPFPVCDLDMRPQHLGGVYDADDTRLLSGPVSIIDRATGTESSIAIPSGYRTAGDGLLVAGGAVVRVRQGTSAFERLLFWRTSAEASNVRAWNVNESSNSIVVLGDYACGRSMSGAANGSIINACGRSSTFSPNDGLSCARFLPVDPLVTTDVSYAACDEGNVLYAYSTNSIPGSHRGLRYRSRAGVITDIAPERSDRLYNPRHHNQGFLPFDVSGDWAVFVSRDGAGNYEWFRRTPAGAIEQLTSLGVTQDLPRLLGFAPNGEVVLAYLEVRKIAPGQDWNSGTWLSPDIGSFRAQWRGRWLLRNNQGAYAENVGAAKPQRCPIPAPPAAGDAGVDGSASVNDDASTPDASATSSSSSSSGGSGASSGVTPDAGVMEAGGGGSAEPDGCSTGGASAVLPLGLLAVLSLATRRRRAERS
jgi:uncharacterized protein (TIGR03382 family)